MTFVNASLGFMLGLATMSDIDNKIIVVMIIVAAIYYFNYTEDFIDAEKD